MKVFLLIVLVIVGVIGYGLYSAKAQAIEEMPLLYENAKLVPLNQSVKHNQKVALHETTLQTGDKVHTSQTGRALIQTGPQIITSLGENTSVLFATKDGDQKKATFMLDSGKLWARLERALEQDEQYEVYTPTLVAAVRGTSFSAEVTEEMERILVAEGVVVVTKRGVEGEGIEVTAGNQVIVEGDTLRVTPVEQSDQNAWWLEHTADTWEWGGSEHLNIITLHREGIFWGNTGLVTVVGTGFNQVKKVTVDGRALSFVPVSDRIVRIPASELSGVRETSHVELHLKDATIPAREVFIGTREEVYQNLLF